MLKQILTFEIRYQLRRPATWLYFAILFLLSFGFLSSDAVEIGGGRGKVLKNAPWVLANTTIILTAIGQVITSALVGTSSCCSRRASRAPVISRGASAARSWRCSSCTSPSR